MSIESRIFLNRFGSYFVSLFMNKAHEFLGLWVISRGSEVKTNLLHSERVKKGL